MRALNYDEAVLILDKAVKERGEDWVFPEYNDCPTCRVADWEDYEPCPWHYSGGCRYFSDDGEPACLVGYVIHEAIDHSQLNMMDIEAQQALDALKILNNWGVLSVDERTAELLYKAQQLQDSGVSWGQAVSQAMQEIPDA